MDRYGIKHTNQTSNSRWIDEQIIEYINNCFGSHSDCEGLCEIQCLAPRALHEGRWKASGQNIALTGDDSAPLTADEYKLVRELATWKQHEDDWRISFTVH